MPVDKDLVGHEGIAVVLVTPDLTADALGNPGLHVFATPALIALFERAAIVALEGSLDSGESSVGNVVRVTHRAPTPLGGTVTARARVRAVEGSGVWFDLEAHDDAEQVGDGEHLRTVIDAARFERRIERKGVALADQRARGDGTADAGRAPTAAEGGTR